MIIQDPKFNQINFESMIFTCINCNNTEALKVFLDKGADLKAPCFLGQTPIFWAAFYKHSDAIKLILDNGVDPSTQIVAAIKYRCSFLAKRLLAQGADPYKALLVAIKQKNTIAIKMLLTNGAKPNQVIFQAINTILDYAFSNKKLKDNLIQNAVKLGNIEIIKQFLDHSKSSKETVKYQDLILLAEESSKTLSGDKKSEVIKLLKSCDPEHFAPAVIIRKKYLILIPLIITNLLLKNLAATNN